MVTAEQIHEARKVARELRDKMIPNVETQHGKVISYLTSARHAFNLVEDLLFHAEVQQRRSERGEG